MKLHEKYKVMLAAAEDSDAENVEGMNTVFSVLALTAAIDKDCLARLSPAGLSESRFVILVLLLKAPAPQSPHELAHSANVTRATITGLLDGLERQNLIARFPDSSDRRRLLVKLTPGGKRLCTKLLREHSTWIATLMSDLDSNEQKTLRSLLAKVWQRTDAGTSV